MSEQKRIANYLKIKAHLEAENRKRETYFSPQEIKEFQDHVDMMFEKKYEEICDTYFSRNGTSIEDPPIGQL